MSCSLPVCSQTSSGSDGTFATFAASATKGRRRLGAADPNSFARPEDHRTTHVALDWHIDFDRKTVRGSARYTFDVQPGRHGVRELLLDADAITVERIVLETNGGGGAAELKFTIADYVQTHGSRLTVELPETKAHDETSGDNQQFTLTIHYETSPRASALQWLTPAQTLGKRHPYLFSQCQPIQARSLLPCQDTPAVKWTFTARVHHPVALTALMSAVRLGSSDGVTEFEQTRPVPSYLVALAVGDVVSRPLGPISNVWAEAAIVDAAAFEFADTARMLQTASDLCGPYVWRQYDLLVMPPSFPFGGMENPCLTFVTPTLLAGDRSLANVVAHEIAHSWTGNLVTNATYEHFWLNEGWTVFVEGKICGRLDAAGEAARDFQSLQYLSELQDTISGQLAGQPQFTKLVVDLSSPISPEDSFSRVPYVKGATFLRYIEATVGGAAVFDPFMRAYFEEFAYKSVVTAQFRASLERFFAGTAAAEQLKRIDWELWLHGVGMPPVLPQFDDQLARVSRHHAGLWTQAATVEAIEKSPMLTDAKNLSGVQRCELLTQLLAAATIPAIGAPWIGLLERTYALGASDTQNCDLRFQFVRLCIRARLPERLDEIVAFANSNFRMKYARPVYREWGAWPEQRERAVRNFEAVREQMMSMCANQVAKELGV